MEEEEEEGDLQYVAEVVEAEDIEVDPSYDRELEVGVIQTLTLESLTCQDLPN